MMHAGLLAQYVVVSLAVIASAGFVLSSRWPQGVRRLRIACAVPLVRDARPAWLRKLGTWIAPAVRNGGPGCGTAGGGCDGCSSH